jgi:hypothetical protein
MPGASGHGERVAASVRIRVVDDEAAGVSNCLSLGSARSTEGRRGGVLLSYDATNARLGRRVTVRELKLDRAVDGRIAEPWCAADRRAARGETQAHRRSS